MFALSDRKSSWQRTLLALLMSSTGFSKTYSLTWKAMVTKRFRRLWFRLVPLVRGIGATECGLLPTLIASDTKNRDGNNPKLKISGRLPRRKTGKSDHSLSLYQVLRFMPTLIRRDGRTFRGARRSPQAMGTEPLCVELGGTPNPKWAEWYMGFPLGWTDEKRSGAWNTWENPSCRKSQSGLVSGLLRRHG